METLKDPMLEKPLSERRLQIFIPDKTTKLGYLLLAISATLYAIEEYYGVKRGNDNLMVFFVHYFIAIAYVIMLLINRSYGIVRSWKQPHLHKTMILLNLFLVSAYALNRQLPVFEDSVTWFCAVLLVGSASTLTYPYSSWLPRPVVAIQHLILGSTLLLYFYMAIYVANFYIFGTIGILALGIGTHIFVPLFLLIATIRTLITSTAPRRIQTRWVVAGMIGTLGFVTAFVIEWNTRVKEIDRIANQSVLNENADLPIWVKAASSIRYDWVSERILKSRFVYSVSDNHFRWDRFPSANRWNEKKKHDPLVFLASGNSNSTLSEDDRQRIVMALSDNRHATEERLWRGDNLATSYIITDIDLYPELRFAYAEHYFNIRNSADSNPGWWGNSEEAIYTFHLPEGSVVTSLSLWVNGKEEKGILTSRQKADQAYKTIVGAERRDPSVVHWQEGNTVTVRVFPCTPQEERKFKIGITSPLPVVEENLVYRNPTFRGPRASQANQTVRVRIVGNSDATELPALFKKNAKGEYLWEGAYDPDLALELQAPPILANRFSFEGYVYSLSPLTPVKTTVAFNRVYLDLNSQWTMEELNSLRPLLSRFNLYVQAENDFVKLSEENWEALTSLQAQRNFSLIPFYMTPKNENTLVLTKGHELSPHLRDVKDSDFANKTAEYFLAGHRVYVYNVGTSQSTYIKSLRELRAFHYAQGNMEQVLSLLNENQFPLATENEDRIVLSASNMVIEKKKQEEDSLPDNAPDHLARLFAYNNIMRKMGVNYFEEGFTDLELVQEASAAYVVSPVSSLIVLETQQDYDRFDIKNQGSSLLNASKEASGAVPEPHEWALIVLFLGFVLFHFRSKITSWVPVAR